jgi:hypothetical protein
MSTEVITVCETTDGGVIVQEGNTKTAYPLTQAPPATSIAVANAKNQLKTKLNLEKVQSELDNCVDLLEVSFYAVNGMTALESSVSALQGDLLAVLGKSADVMADFECDTKLILKNFFMAYKFLKIKNAAKVLEKFSSAENFAKSMVTKFQDLALSYQKLQDDAKLIVTNATEERAKQYQDQDSIIAMRTQMEEEMEAFKSMKKSYSDELSELESEYGELNKKLEKAENRQFALELTQVIVTGLGAVAEGAIAIYANQTKIPSAAPASEGSAGGKKAKDSTKTESGEKEGNSSAIADQLAKKQEEKKAADAEVEEKQKAFDDAQKKVTTSTDDKGKEDLEKKRDKASDELKDAKAKQQALQVAIKTLQDGCSAVSESCQKAADSQSSIIDNYNQRIKAVFDLKYKIKEKEIENLSNMAKYTKEIADSHITESAVQLAIQALILAITSMNTVELIFSDMVEFWNKLGLQCKVLSSSGMDDEIALEEDTQDWTQSNELMTAFFIYLIDWTALESVAESFLDHMESSKEHLRDTIKTPELDREDAWKKAPQLAEPLFKKLNVQLNLQNMEKAQVNVDNYKKYQLPVTVTGQGAGGSTNAAV